MRVSFNLVVLIWRLPTSPTVRWKVWTWAEETGALGKCLPGKHEDLCSVPQNPHKARHGSTHVNPSPENHDHPAWCIEWRTRELVSNQEEGEDRQLRLSSALYTCAMGNGCPHSYIQTNIHTQTYVCKYKKKVCFKSASLWTLVTGTRETESVEILGFGESFGG